jgi:phosphoribosylformylglycinamidine cyclo-ligase
MFRAFNMGIGMVVICAARDAGRVIDMAARAGEPSAIRLGVIAAGERGVYYV